jgi:hypothetical protein
MESLFLSYARSDQPFLRTLYDALTVVGYQSWVDWEGIPPTAAWLAEIFTAIDASATVICVLSPEMISSEQCRREVRYALESGKRIIPLVSRDVSMHMVRQDEALAPLASINWIFMRESDDFDVAFQRLRGALDRDFAYWQLAGTMLARTKQWDRRGRERALVLRGAELRRAERWLVEGANKEPRPLPLVVYYIMESRRAAGLVSRLFGSHAEPPPEDALSPHTPQAMEGVEVAQPTPTMKTAIFISYRSSERPSVSTLAARLQQQGYDVWFDQRLRGGQSWWDEILQNIRRADVFLFALTPSSHQSTACQREFGYAHGLNKRIVPLLLAGEVDLRLLPPALQQIQVVDYRTADDGVWATLVEALADLPLAAAPPDPLPPPPEAPVSPLGSLKEQLDTPNLTFEQQVVMVFQLKGLLKSDEESGAARQVLQRLAEHPDLRASIAEEVRGLLTSTS